MPPATRLNITVSEKDLELLRQVAPKRQLSSFIRAAALEKARLLKREEIRRQFLEAIEADPDYLATVGREWDVVFEEGWPEP